MHNTSSLSSNSDHWYLVHCKPRKELYAANALRTLQGLLVFLPESQIRSHGEVKRVPFFSGYIFAQADLQKVSRSQINTSPGVIRLVEFGGDPQPVPNDVIEMISKRVDELNGLEPQPCHKFCLGDVVRVKQGPLQDLEMVFIGTTTPGTRARVLLHLLGRLKEVSVDAENLEKKPCATNMQQDLHIRQERRTRGKGRKIRDSFS